MSTFTKVRKPVPTDLTWEEQNPFSYLLDAKVFTELKEVIKQAKKESKKQAKIPTFQKKKQRYG